VIVNQRSSFLRSKQLARLAGVSTDTLRYYERNSLILKPARSSNGYREYPPETLDRIVLVRGALSIGFTVRELRRILKERDKGGSPCLEVRDLARKKLAQTEEMLRQLVATRDELKRLIRAWNIRLSRTPHGQPARLLESHFHKRNKEKKK